MVVFTEERKRKISEGLKRAHARKKDWVGGFYKGHPHFPVKEKNKKAWLEKIRKINIGRKHTKETIEKYKLAKLGKKYPHLWRGKFIKCSVCGKEKYKYPRDFKRNRGKNAGTFCSKKCAYSVRKGISFSPSTQFKRGRRPEESWNWKGGVTPIHNKIRASFEYKLWQDSVLNRDGNKCKKCGENRTYKLVAHHILNFSSYVELRFAIDNGITFCKECHNLFHRIYKKRNNTREQVIEFLR